MARRLKILDKYPKIDYLYQCIRKINDKEYVDRVLHPDPYTIKCDSFGTLNMGKNIYLIKAGRKGQGFFAEFRSILGYLFYCERFGFTPVVEIGPDFPYYEIDGVHGKNNAFEYYFQQVSDVSLEEAYNSFNVFNSHWAHLTYAESFEKENFGYSISESYLNKMGGLVRKYIFLQPWIKEYIKQSIAQIGGIDNTLGIHVRGSDFKMGYAGHPVLITPEKYADAASGIMDEKSYSKIFLATDDLHAIEVFKKRFGGKLAYYTDVKRTDEDVSVAFSEDNRKNHHYLLGLEVLRDAWTLAGCTGLVAGKSQVSICAQIINFSEKGNLRYSSVDIIDTGINKNNAVRFDAREIERVTRHITNHKR